MRNEPFIQYTYHFPYPINSIDVRKITQAETEWAIATYNKNVNVQRPHDSFKTIKQMFIDHFPEYFI